MTPRADADLPRDLLDLQCERRVPDLVLPDNEFVVMDVERRPTLRVALKYISIVSTISLAPRTPTETAASAGAATCSPGRLGVDAFSGETACVDQTDDSRPARVPSRLAIALSVSVVAHACLISLVGVQPHYPLAQVSGALEVRIVPVTAAGVGHTEPAVEATESVLIASSDATPPATGETDVRPSSLLQASPVEETRATNQRQAVDAPIPMVEEPPIATLQASPPPSPIYYAESEVDAMPVALDPIVPRYPSGSDAATDGGKVTLRLLIDALGVVTDVVVVEAGLPEVFEESARNALTSIRFKPAEKDGKTVACQTVISVFYAGANIAAHLRD